MASIGNWPTQLLDRYIDNKPCPAPLVQEMLDRGVPAEEIVDVVLAMGTADEDDPRLGLIHRRCEDPKPEPGLAS